MRRRPPLQWVAAAAVAVGGVSHRSMMTKIMMLKIMMMEIINPGQSAPAVPRVMV